MADEFKRMRQLIGTTADWAANDLVLGDGEIAVEVLDASHVQLKMGDGVSAFSACPYIITPFATSAEVGAGNDDNLAISPLTLWQQTTMIGGVPAAQEKIVRANADGLIDYSFLNVSTTGGAGEGGKIPVLNANGVLPASMLDLSGFQGSGNGWDSDTLDGLDSTAFVRVSTDQSVSGVKSWSSQQNFIAGSTNAGRITSTVNGEAIRLYNGGIVSGVGGTSINVGTYPNTLAAVNLASSQVSLRSSSTGNTFTVSTSAISAGNGSGVNYFQTVAAASGGLQVNNTLTGAGLERVLTTSDIQATGPGSGFDADTLDGLHASAFATAAQGALANTALQPGDNISELVNDANYLTADDMGSGSGINADLLDSLDSSQFLRSDTSDSFTSGVLSITSSSDSPLTIDGTSNNKIALAGSSYPAILYKEMSTTKAYTQWHSGGYFKIKNEGDGSELRIQDSFLFSKDGSTFYSVWHGGNLIKTSFHYSTTDGEILRVGDYGLGFGPIVSTDLNWNNHTVPGNHYMPNGSTNAPPLDTPYLAQVIAGSTSGNPNIRVVQIAYPYSVANNYAGLVYIRALDNSGWSAWRQLASAGGSITGNITINDGDMILSNGVTTGRVRVWDGINDTDIDAIVTGNTSTGLLVEGTISGHLTLGINSNDATDGLQVISKSAFGTDYDKLCFEVKADGDTSIYGETAITEISTITPIAGNQLAIAIDSDKRALLLQNAETGTLAQAVQKINITNTTSATALLVTAQAIDRLKILASGALLVANGSASTPSLTLLSDQDTGIFGNASGVTNTLGFSTGGTERMLINQYGNVNINGVSTTSAKFQVRADDIIACNLYSISSLYPTIPLLRTDQTTTTAGIAMTVRSSGADRLQIMNNGTIQTANGSATAPSFSLLNDSNTGIYGNGSDSLYTATAGVQRLHIDANGRVGIGIDAQSTGQLTIATPDNVKLALRDTDGNSSRITFEDSSGAVVETITGNANYVQIGGSSGAANEKILRIGATGLQWSIDGGSNFSNVKPSQVTLSASRSMLVSDIGNTLKVTAASLTYTIASASGENGDMLQVWSSGFSGTIISISGGTLYWQQGGTQATGNRTIAPYSVVTLMRDSASSWIIYGNGIS